MNKSIDCIKLKHKIQEEIYKELKPSSVSDYFSKIIESSQKTKLLSSLLKKAKYIKLKPYHKWKKPS